MEEEYSEIKEISTTEEQVNKLVDKKIKSALSGIKLNFGSLLGGLSSLNVEKDDDEDSENIAVKPKRTKLSTTRTQVAKTSTSKTPATKISTTKTTRNITNQKADRETIEEKQPIRFERKVVEDSVSSKITKEQIYRPMPIKEAADSIIEEKNDNKPKRIFDNKNNVQQTHILGLFDTDEDVY